jgi:putative ABC transport system permease protein
MRGRWVDELVQDVRYGARALRSTPGFTAIAVATLGMGVGANALIFSILSGVLLRPLPYRDPDRLVQINQTAPAFGLMALRSVQEYRAASTTIESMAGYVPSSRVIQDAGGPERLGVVLAERALFRVLGVEAAFGRTFGDDDGLTAVVVSAEYARRRFGTEAAAVGQSLVMEGSRFTVLGVLPDAFRFPYDTARFPGTLAGAPIALWGVLEPPSNPRSGIDFTVGRLRPGVARSAARDEMNAIAARLAAQYPESYAGFGVELTPLIETIVGAVRPRLVALFVAVGLVLLVACANVANLLLVRASARAREMAVRVALGAGRGRIVRQLVTESALLGLMGGVAGLAVATWGTPLVLALSASRIPRGADIAMDWRVFGFLLVVSVATGLAFGLAPALAASRTDVQGALKGGTGPGSSRPIVGRVRDALAAAEVALAFVLVVGAGLVARELVRLRNTDTGLAPAGVLTMHVSPDVSAQMCDELADAVESLPGVRAAAFAQMLPLQSWGWTATFSIVGRAPFLPSERPVVELRYVTPRYFDALGVPVRQGRAFTDADVAETPRVVIVNETLARRYFAGASPVGQLTDRGTIVGVVGDVRQAGVDRATLPEIFFPIAQNMSQVRDLGMSLIVSTRVPPASLAAPVRDVIRRAYPDLAVFQVKTMEQVVSESLSEPTLYVWLVGAFALLALVLACAGIYGVVSYAVAARTREFGIRFALGATGGQVQRRVLGHAAALVAAGLGAGLVGLVGFVRPLERLVAGAGRLEPLAVTAAAAVLAAVAFMASLAPARRAAAVDPAVALRRE